MASLRHGTPLHRFGVDLDGLHARLVRVAYTRFADGVVAAARAEHLFVALRSSRRVLLSLLREALLYVPQRSRDVAARRCSESCDRCGPGGLRWRPMVLGSDRCAAIPICWRLNMRLKPAHATGLSTGVCVDGGRVFTNERKRKPGVKKRVFWRSICAALACVRALRIRSEHRPTQVVPSTAAWTAQQTRAQASAQAARKLRLFKHSEIAARAVDDARPEAR